MVKPIALCFIPVASDGSSDRSSMVNPLLFGSFLRERWVVGSILHGEPIALCFIPVVRAFTHGAVGRRIDPPW